MDAGTLLAVVALVCAVLSLLVRDNRFPLLVAAVIVLACAVLVGVEPLELD